MSEPLVIIGGVPVYRDGDALRWSAGLAIDADGSPRAYSPEAGKGLDNLANAGHAGNWWGLVTDNGQPNGVPILAPDGYFISPTALVDHAFPLRDRRRYVDSSSVPYIAVPPQLLGLDLLHTGDLAAALRLSTGAWSPAVVADVGPRKAIGEGSIALAHALGINSDPRHGGCSSGVACVVFIGSHRHYPWPLSAQQLAGASRVCLETWGGIGRLRLALP